MNKSVKERTGKAWERIKIYYSKQRPQNSETSANSNYTLWIAVFILVCFVGTFALCYISDHLG